MSSSAQAGASPERGIEQHSIEPIPAEERHGSVASLFTIWFGSNMQLTTIVTGALATVLGLSLQRALLAILLGNAFGAVFMALHSAQGPKLGIPQMIQSRAQFGFYGACVPIALVLLMYLGYFASSAVLGGETLAAAWGLGFTQATLILSVVTALLSIYGYRAIHRLARYFSAAAAVAFLYLSVRLLNGHDLAGAWHAGSTSFGLFLLVVSISATWQITYAPYVADYSRYLPETTSIRAAFWWTYAGSVLACVWMMWLGAIAAATARAGFSHDSSSFLVNLAAQRVRWSIILVIAVGIVAANVLNLYGMFMSVATTISSIRPVRVTRRLRAVWIGVLALLGTLVAILGQGNFITNFENFILFLAYFLIPWTAINLADFYIVRKERYDIRSIFNPNGIYGRLNWRTLCAYAVAVLAEIPFVKTSFYTGGAVASVGGADIAWIVGLILATLLYILLMRAEARQARAALLGSAES
jgi:NCS1 family nucleobase:cation symporter-1